MQYVESMIVYGWRRSLLTLLFRYDVVIHKASAIHSDGSLSLYCLHKEIIHFTAGNLAINHRPNVIKMVEKVDTHFIQ